MEEKAHEPSATICFHSQTFVHILVNDKHMFCTGNEQKKGQTDKKRERESYNRSVLIHVTNACHCAICCTY